MGLVCFKQYQTDQLPGRVTDAERVFGSPSAASDDSEYSSDSSSDEEETSEESSDSGSEDEYADEEE